MTLLAGTSLAVLAQSQPETETATLVVYSGGSLLRSALPRSSAGVFEGGVFDNDKVMARLRFRSILILRIPPGAHTFSASTSDWHPAKNSQIYLDAIAGHTYYLRAMLEHDSLSLLGNARGRLETVSCQTALDETVKHTLLPQSQISDDYKKSVMDSVPGCAKP